MWTRAELKIRILPSIDPEFVVFDYAAWLRRALRHFEEFRALPGETRVEIEAAPPVPRSEIAAHLEGIRIPTPECLIRFWTEASAAFGCTFWWDTPPQFQRQMRIAFPHWSMSHIWGGAQTIAPWHVATHLDDLAETVERFRDFPTDYRLSQHSIPFFSTDTGDLVALYVRDTIVNPPVALISHEGYNCSFILSPSFEQFLAQWERVGYLAVAFLSFRTDDNSLDIDAFPSRREALDSLLRGEVHFDLNPPADAMTAAKWEESTDYNELFKYLDGVQGTLDRRKKHLFACACCRRVWNMFGDLSKAAVEVAERFAEGRATDGELYAARAKLTTVDIVGGFHEFVNQIRAGADHEAAYECYASLLNQDRAANRSFLRMSDAAADACDTRHNGCVLTPWSITRYLDGLDRQREEHAHADLFRHVFGNPFAAPIDPPPQDDRVISLARRLYHWQEPVAHELQRVLADNGQSVVAEHFARPDHPKGCWALDLILRT
jgi:hypothetical protein